MDLTTETRRFRSEDRCRAYLEQLRWPEGVACPRCGTTSVSRLRNRGQFDCNSCRYQFSVTTGTYLQDTHLPLWKWVLGVYVIAESDEGISANRMKDALRVSYKTAWYLCHRIRAAMRDAIDADADPSVERTRGQTVVGGAMQGGRAVHLQVAQGADRRSLRPYHRVSLKHLGAYLGEIDYRLENRQNPRLLPDTLACLLRQGNLPYKSLID